MNHRTIQKLLLLRSSIAMLLPKKSLQFARASYHGLGAEWKTESGSEAKVVVNSEHKISTAPPYSHQEEEAQESLPSSNLSKKNSLVIFDKDGTLICFHSMWTPWALSTAQRIQVASGLKSLDIREQVFCLLGFDPEEKRVVPGLLAEATMPVIRGKLVQLLVINGMDLSHAELVINGIWEQCDTSTSENLKSLFNLKYLFETLRKNQFNIAVCTADSRQGTEKTLRSLELSHLVDVVVCGDDKGAQPKPSPHNALKICKALGIDPSDTYMVGDTMADMGMGKSARLGGTIGVLSGVGSEKELGGEADHVVPSVANLLPIVLRKGRKEAKELWAREVLRSNTSKARKYREYLDEKGGPRNPEADLIKQILSTPRHEWDRDNPWIHGQRKSFHSSPFPLSPRGRIKEGGKRGFRTSVIAGSQEKAPSYSRKVMMRRYFAGLSPWDEKKPTHIIVGAGSAGCVLANRLSEDPENRVLLMEAGPRDDWWRWKIHMPAALMYNLSNAKYNWYYHTLAQPQMEERVLYWPRGKVWGGSSSLNAMAYVRGHPYDYDRWEKEGATAWAYRNCLPYFKRSQSHDLGEDAYRGAGGPLKVSRGKCDNPLYQAFLRAGQEAGYGFTNDMNGFKQEGVGVMDMTIHNGSRWSASRAYLWPALERKNLKIESNIFVTRVLFDKQRAVGVQFTRKPRAPEKIGYLSTDNTEKIYCEAEVILCGGAVNTPHLLILSGVGPRDQLYNFHISPVVEIPGVGKNLQDHLEIYVQQKSKKPITLYDKLRTVVHCWEVLQSSWRFPHNMVRIGTEWLLRGSGEGASSHLEAGGFVRSGKDVEHPDIQLHFLAGTVHDHGRKPMKEHAFQVHVGPMRPKSTGWIKLKDENPLTDVMIQPNYLSEEEDRLEFRQCVRVARNIFAQPAFEEFRAGELVPGSELESDWELDEFVRSHSDSAYHPSCTCKMGRWDDPMAVVNPETMGVYGLDNLKVVDASVMPSIVSGNLNGPVIMVAEKAADMIRGKTPLEPVDAPVWKPEGEHLCPDTKIPMENQ